MDPGVIGYVNTGSVTTSVPFVVALKPTDMTLLFVVRFDTVTLYPDDRVFLTVSADVAEGTDGGYLPMFTYPMTPGSTEFPSRKWANPEVDGLPGQQGCPLERTLAHRIKTRYALHG